MGNAHTSGLEDRLGLVPSKINYRELASQLKPGPVMDYKSAMHQFLEHRWQELSVDDYQEADELLGGKTRDVMFTYMGGNGQMQVERFIHQRRYRPEAYFLTKFAINEGILPRPWNWIHQ